MRIENNPSACVNESLRGERTCAECYWSQVNDRNQWTGNDECWNSQCLVAAKDEEAMAEQPESFADVLDILRQAARGDFPDATGFVTENFMVLMGRGLGDSTCAAFNEYADRLQAAHEREVEGRRAR